MKEKVAELIEVIFGFRKFILMVLIFVLGVVFRLKNLINGAELVDLLKGSAEAFFAANGFEHLVTSVREYVGSKGLVEKAASILATNSKPQDGDINISGE